MVSIIMPVYNMADYLDRAVDSVISQTYADWELIAIDDGSSDDSGKNWTTGHPVMPEYAFFIQKTEGFPLPGMSD